MANTKPETHEIENAASAEKPYAENAANLRGYRPQEPIPCCTLLRAKSMYYRHDERPGRLHPSDVMGFWCLETQRPVGPDHAEAEPHECQLGRKCFRGDE